MHTRLYASKTEISLNLTATNTEDGFRLGRLVADLEQNGVAHHVRFDGSRETVCVLPLKRREGTD